MLRASQVFATNMSTDPPPSTAAEPLRHSLRVLRGVTASRQELLRALGLETVGDLLFHFPRSYEDLTDVRPIGSLVEGQLQTVRGEVVEIEGKQLADGRTIVSVVLSDGGKHCLEGVWFNQPYAAQRLRYGQPLAFSGKPKWRFNRWQMTSPRIQNLDGAGGSTAEAQPAPPDIVPVYPLTADLRAEQLRRLIQRAVEQYARHLSERLPAELRRRHGWPDVVQAMRDVHFPPSLPAAQTGRRRFIYEEFLVLQLALALRRRDLRDRQRAPRLRVSAEIDRRIRRLFPFSLTQDQNQAIADICGDLASDRPMQRLLQADVGAGKTAVAVYALLVAVANQHQAVIMAPTEVLARQHWHTLEGYLAHSRVRRLLLTGSRTPRERKEALAALQAGEVDLVVGTQALVQEDVQFARLGLVVIDEQHKFGVNQRARVRRLGIDPHYLVMTATPIPRTMALTVFGDLDVSVIRQPPPGRQAVKTTWKLAAERPQVYEKVREEVRKGRQAFVVCPLVSESEVLQLKAAEETFEELRSGIFREQRVGLMHGRLGEEEREQIMRRFRKHELDLLVCTTVVEVGVDIPNATLLVVEHAERFGLSQLHQMRGRISRGDVAGLCYLVTGPVGEEAKVRLQALVRSGDGFALAEQDAQLRGLGEFFGTRQHGLGDLRLGSLFTDQDLLQLARRDALEMVAADAGLRRLEHALLRQAVLERYGKSLDLAAIG